jgi:hypothetical protein
MVIGSNVMIPRFGTQAMDGAGHGQHNPAYSLQRSERYETR